MSSNYNKGFRSVYKLNAHIVLVTKYRQPAINKERLERLHTIFKETLSRGDNTLGCEAGQAFMGCGLATRVRSNAEKI